MGRRFAQASIAIDNGDGVTLADALTLEVLSEDGTPAARGGSLPSPFLEVFSHHAACMAELAPLAGSPSVVRDASFGERVDRAFDSERQALTSLLPALSSHPPNIAIPPLRALCRNVRRLAANATKEGSEDDAARLLQRCFGLTVNDRSKRAPGAADEEVYPGCTVPGKRSGALYVITQLMTLYFRMGNLKLCKNLTAAVAGNFPPLEKYPASERVAYAYFEGRLAQLDGRYSESADRLSFALAAVEAAGPGRFEPQARTILTYLVPVRMLAGLFPRRALLERHGLADVFWPVVEATRAGNLRALRDALSANEAYFVDRGILLILENLRDLALRNLFKKVYLISREDSDPAQSPKLDLAAFRAALACTGVDMDADEIECVVASLIVSKYMKGYISHKHAKVVLSKAQPFPPISTVPRG